MSEELLRFTAESIEQARKSQSKYAWIMLAAIVCLIVGFTGAQSMAFAGVVLVIIAGVGWSRWATKIQQRTREYLEAKAAGEATSNQT
ncbi:hypothetical protein OOZ51_04940 [Arthrobacter sp. MI7-26]|uniref:hypothetical protein n=1 Tax=Arthrobacter sp. MI7-26 TaxID=2993653 RepID=UPI002248BDD3|nr:hypothetical protein [Arthrobacter sp. MI7-26]MCX2747160.1 hypothetical protein [Arthrobacter sp. MI7-26]